MQHQSKIDELTFPPTTQPVPDLLPKADVRNKSIVKITPSGIPSAIISSRPSPLRQRHQTAIVKPHGGAGDPSAQPVEWQIEKFSFRIAVSGPDQPDIIAADIEEKRGRHQIGVSHVVIFVFV